MKPPSHYLRHVVALYDFTANRDGRLSFVAGDKFKVMDDSKMWWAAKDATGKIGSYSPPRTPSGTAHCTTALIKCILTSLHPYQWRRLPFQAGYRQTIWRTIHTLMQTTSK